MNLRLIRAFRNPQATADQLRNMEQGVVMIDELPGGFDLRETLESGQSYCWRRQDGEMYDPEASRSGWYETVIEGEYLRVRQQAGRLEWESTTEGTDLVYRLLRLDDDLRAIYQAFPDDPLIEEAVNRYRGMRLVRDPPFPCLISFICSAQMRVERIFQMQERLAETYGDVVRVNGERKYSFPRPEQLAAATEAELRDLGLGYRAPYVCETAQMVADGVDPREAASLPYEEARSYLTQYVGVGEKVADCVLLFSLGFLQAVPLDTWIRTAIAQSYPDCEGDTYATTSRAIREQFGNEYAGYAQTYVFHHLRSGG